MYSKNTHIIDKADTQSHIFILYFNIYLFILVGIYFEFLWQAKFIVLFKKYFLPVHVWLSLPYTLRDHTSMLNIFIYT